MLATAARWSTMVFVMSLSAAAQAKAPKQTAVHVPRFKDYLVTDIFHGTPVAPHLATPTERLFRTRIRDGVTKGLGVMREGKEQPGPNFAGHYIVIEWGCGSPCGMMAIVDALTGKVYTPPISPEGFMLPFLPVKVPGDPDAFVSWVAEVEFRLNSCLMIVKANPDPSKGRSNYTFYFLWKNDHWTLLRRVPLTDTTP
jgi:hypothetical protein